MSLQIIGSDVPACSEPGCQQLAMDGYCFASCCVETKRAYCAFHSHRPAMLLELLGHPAQQETFTGVEVRAIMMAMWKGAGNIFEAQGYLELMKDVAKERIRKAQEELQRKAASPPQ